VLVPGPLLAIFATTNVVFERYALFSLPFYLLLLSGVVAVGAAPTGEERGKAGTGHGRSHRKRLPLPQEIAAVAAAGLVGLFAIGLYNYAGPNPSVHITPNDSTRQLSRYLASVVQEHDSILFAGWFGSAPSFYWPANVRMPAVYRSAEDPIPLAGVGSGKVYWVIDSGEAYADKARLSTLWSQVIMVGSILVLREDSPADVHQAAATIESYLLSSGGTEARHSAHMMMGSARQSRGEILKAVSEYQAAGTYFLSLGPAYLHTAREYARRGDWYPAWTTALQSREYEPENADVHTLLAELMEQRGETEAAQREQAVASALSGASSNPLKATLTTHK